MTTPTAPTKKPGHLLAQTPGVVPPCEEKNVTTTLPTVLPNVIHPVWCDPNYCSEDRSPDGVLYDVCHWAAPATWTNGRRFVGNIQLAGADNCDGTEEDPRGERVVHLELGHPDYPLTVDELEQLGHWLVARAAQYRSAIATESGEVPPAVTVLDDDLDLKVREVGDLIVLDGDTEDGQWYFGPREARYLADALHRHAAQIEAPVAAHAGGAAR